MNRVLVIGGCGAGKTTFAKKLAAITGLPLTHLDVLGWRGDWEKVPRGEFDEALAAVLREERWIIDGNYTRSLPERLRRADMVFWFDLPGIACLAGVVGRVIRNHGQARDDMGGNCRETLDRERFAFFRYALTMNRKIRPRIRAALDDAPGVEVTVFHARRQADRYLDTLTDRIKEEKDGVE
ncbi:MAG: topology modulation protein [Clostridia bacterium]|nr:topology modulation protein [Clostridia bacterium]